MSSDEQRDIAGKTFVELAEAKKRLAALQKKATNYGNDLRTIASSIAPFRDERRASNAHEIALEAMERYPAKEEVLQLIGEIRETEAKLESLTRQLTDQGYPQ